MYLRVILLSINISGFCFVFALYYLKAQLKGTVSNRFHNLLCNHTPAQTYNHPTGHKLRLCYIFQGRQQHTSLVALLDSCCCGLLKGYWSITALMSLNWLAGYIIETFVLGSQEAKWLTSVTDLPFPVVLSLCLLINQCLYLIPRLMVVRFVETFILCGLRWD